MANSSSLPVYSGASSSPFLDQGDGHSAVTIASNAASSTARKTDGKKESRLALRLDFARISHETTCTHPHILFSPIHYEPGYAYPLLVWLHDLGSDERQMMRVMPEVSMRNFVAVAPQGFRMEPACETPKPASLDVAAILQAAKQARATLGWPETVAALTEIEERIFDCIKLAQKRTNIAPRRVFLAGVGMGGTMALRMAFQHPEHFAGVASLGGALPQGKNMLKQWKAARAMPLFWGWNQASLSKNQAAATELGGSEWNGKHLVLLHTAGFPLTVREYDDDQPLVPAMLHDLNRWMMNLVCGN